MSVKKGHDFRPTPAMELYAYKRAKVGEDASIKSVAESIGITRETASRWQALPGFLEWLDERVAYYRSPVLDLIEQVGISKLMEFKFWEALAIKFGYVTGKSDDEEAGRGRGQAATFTPLQMAEFVQAAREGKK